MAALKRFCQNTRKETIEELGQFLREQNKTENRKITQRGWAIMKTATFQGIKCPNRFCKITNIKLEKGMFSSTLVITAPEMGLPHELPILPV
jgi:hypothetical protein